MKITYLELLKMVEEGKQPENIKYMGSPFTWNGCEYENDKDNNLTPYISAWTTKAQTTANTIEYNEEILTVAERNYLSAVIKPFRNSVKSIEKLEIKSFYKKYQYINIEYDEIDKSVSGGLSFPVFEEGSLYKGMELDKEYTLEELGL